jgi:putative spermidine/putrescine transport system permease protein
MFLRWVTAGHLAFGSDFPAAAALALLITATCSAMLATGEWIGSKHERYL